MRLLNEASGAVLHWDALFAAAKSVLALAQDIRIAAAQQGKAVLRVRAKSVHLAPTLGC
jgi:hypothetical protein